VPVTFAREPSEQHRLHEHQPEQRPQRDYNSPSETATQTHRRPPPSPAVLRPAPSTPRLRRASPRRRAHERLECELGRPGRPSRRPGRPRCSTRSRSRPPSPASGETQGQYAGGVRRSDAAAGRVGARRGASPQSVHRAPRPAIAAGATLMRGASICHSSRFGRTLPTQCRLSADAESSGGSAHTVAPAARAVVAS
jgi:hypothetical protein